MALAPVLPARNMQVEEHLVHESFIVDTRDHEDHTFCGVMFDAECCTRHPAEYIEISAIWVRGQLGPMTIWQTPEYFEGKQEREELWTKIYEANHAPSQEECVALRLDTPIRLRPGESCGLYVHSALPGDEGIVYDNQRSTYTYVDRVLRVYPGYAHLSNRPFGKRGFWGRPWRSNREFVGRMEYGVRWRMWQPNPATHRAFPLGFQAAVMAMIMASRRPESLMYLLQDEVRVRPPPRRVPTPLLPPPLPPPPLLTCSPLHSLSLSSPAGVLGARRRLSSSS
jgi:hypothetical protein